MKNQQLIAMTKPNRSHLKLLPKSELLKSSDTISKVTVFIVVVLNKKQLFTLRSLILL